MKKYLIVSISILILIALSAGGYMWWKKNKFDKDLETFQGLFSSNSDYCKGQQPLDKTQSQLIQDRSNLLKDVTELIDILSGTSSNIDAVISKLGVKDQEYSSTVSLIPQNDYITGARVNFDSDKKEKAMHVAVDLHCDLKLTINDMEDKFGKWTRLPNLPDSAIPTIGFNLSNTFLYVELATPPGNSKDDSQIQIYTINIRKDN